MNPRAAVAILQDADIRDELLRADDGRVRSAEHRRAVDAALAASNPDLRVHALRVIGRTQRAEFLPAALAALAHPSLDVRREAAFAIAHIGSGDPQAFAAAERALRDALGTETDLLVGAALAEEYGRLPFASRVDVDSAARALDVLLTRFGRNGPPPSFVALGVARGAESLARRVVKVTGTSPAAPTASDEVATLLAKLYASQRPTGEAQSGVIGARIRRLAMTGLSALDRLKKAHLQAAIDDPDEQVRRIGVIALARGPVTGEQSRRLLTDDSVLVRHAVASRIGVKLPAIADAALADAHVNVRAAALDALGEARACRVACEALLEKPGAYDSNWHDAAHALVALARTNPDRARSHVARAATGATWQVRMYAARAAGYSRQAEVVSTLASDANVNVRHAALLAWRDSDLPGLAAAALDALESDDGQLVLEAVRSLAAAPVPAEVMAALRMTLARLTALRRDTSRDPRLALIELIAERDPDRDRALRPYLADFDPVVAARVAALLNVDVPAAAPSTPAPVPTWADVEALGQTTVTFRLRGGRALTMRLYAEQAPTAVARLVTQVRAGEWNGRTFHRVEPGFVVQGGSPAANEYAGAAAFTRDEFSALSHVRGTIGISTRGPDTGDGQIFINLADNARLDFGYTIIGSVTGDIALIDDIVEGEVIEAATAQGPAQPQ